MKLYRARNFHHAGSNYLVTTDLSITEKKLLFSLRTRMFNVKTNYRKKYEYNMYCSLSQDTSEEESEEHLLKCTKIIQKLSDPTEIENATYSDIFSKNLSDQVKITKIFAKIVKAQSLLQNS